MLAIRFHSATALVFALVLFANCASMKERSEPKENQCPSWVNTGRSEQYPAENYLVGIASGDSLQQAKKRARSEVAESLEVSISKEWRSATRYFVTETNTGNISQKEMKIEKQLQTQTAMVLKGVEIPETCFEGTRYYALAVLDRQKAGKRLTADIHRLDQETTSWKEQAENSNQPLQKIRFLKRALAILLERQKLNAKLAVIDKGIDDVHNLAELTALLDRTFTTCTIAVLFANHQADSVRETVIEGISKLGFSFVEPDQSPDLKLILDVSAKASSVKNERFVFADCSLSARIVDTATKEGLAMIPLSRREGHQTLESAKTSCMLHLREQVTQKITDSLKQFTMQW